MENLFLCYFLHTVVRAGRAAPLGLQERNRPRQRKSSGLQGMSEMPKDSACLWNIGLFYQMTCWGCHMACAWHSVQDNRAWVHACSALGAGMTEVEPVWSDSTDFSSLHCAFSGRFSKNMTNTEAEGGLLRLMIPEWLSQHRIRCHESPVNYVYHHCQQQQVFASYQGAHVFMIYILQTTSPEVPRWCHNLKQWLKDSQKG